MELLALDHRVKGGLLGVGWGPHGESANRIITVQAEQLEDTWEIFSIRYAPAQSWLEERYTNGQTWRMDWSVPVLCGRTVPGADDQLRKL